MQLSSRRAASTQKQLVLTTKRTVTPGPFVSLQLSLSRKRMRFIKKKRHILCDWRLIYPQLCLSAQLPPACHCCTQRAARRFALRRRWFQVISESKEFRIHSARRVTSLSPQAVQAVLSRAGSCLCIPPRRS